MNNKEFFKKNCIKIVIAAVIIVLAVISINYLQNRISAWHQNSESIKVLQQVSDTLDANEATAQTLSDAYHQGNREILADLKQMINDKSEYKSLTTSSATTTGSSSGSTKTTSSALIIGSTKLTGLIESDFAPYLFLTDAQGNVSISADKTFVGRNLVTDGFVTSSQFQQLISCPEDGVLCAPYDEDGNFYFYATSMDTSPETYLIIGFENDLFEERISSLTDYSSIVQTVNLANGQAIIALDTTNGVVKYCSDDGLKLSGKKLDQLNVPDALMNDQGNATTSIQGKDYLCSSVVRSDGTVLVMAVSTEVRFADNYKPTVWAMAILIMSLLLIIHYALLLPKDLTKAKKRQKIVRVPKTKLVFNATALAKSVPLVVLGLLLVFGSTFYCRTILKLSWAMDEVERPLSQLSDQLAQIDETKKEVNKYCDQMYVSQAQMIANMIEVDPSCLNESQAKVYERFNQAGKKETIADDEGNPLKSVPQSTQLQDIVNNNGVLSVQLYNDQGYLIASNGDDWNYQLSHDENAQSSAFYDVVLGKVDYMVQDAQVDDGGNYNQYVGVAYNYYTTKNDDGSTLYVSRMDYKQYLNGSWSGNPITAHQSVLQISVDMSVRQEMMGSLDLSYLMEHVALDNDAYCVVFDNSSDHKILYTPNEQNMGKNASDLGISDEEFSGNFNGFQTVEGVEYYECCRYSDGYYVAIATPTESLYANRLQSSVLITLASAIAMALIMALFLLVTKDDMIWLQTDANELERPETDVSVRRNRSKSFAKWWQSFVRWSADEKITVMLRIFLMLIGIYFIIGLLSGGLLFSDNGAINYVFSDSWERGPNIFAFTKSVAVMVVAIVCVEIVTWFARQICAVFSSNAETVVNLLVSLGRYVTVIAAMFYCLYLFGMDAMSLLVSAGLLTLIIGLGAQSLISDMLASVFIIFEGYYHVGDLIVVDKKPGFVTEIGIRSTRIRNLDNSITICNNSQIKEVVNMAVKNYLVKLKFEIATSESLERVEGILKKELPLFKERIPQLTTKPSYKGIVEIDDCQVDLLCVFTCKGADNRKVLHAVYREFKLLYERYNIQAPYKLEVVANGGSLEELDRLNESSNESEDKQDAEK